PALATTVLYPLSLHDALPISVRQRPHPHAATVELGHRTGPDHLVQPGPRRRLRARPGDALLGAAVLADRAARRLGGRPGEHRRGDRKSTRLNSSHVSISYAVF